MMGMTEEMKSYNLGDSGHDGDEGVSARISKCAEWDSSDKILPKTKLRKSRKARCDSLN